MSDGGPLAGVRVLECAGWNGVYAGRIFAEGGADVVRVVPPQGDPLAAEPPFFGGGASVQDAWYNAGKRVVVIDLASAAGKDQARQLAGRADILLHDWPAGAAPLDLAAVLAANPALVVVAVTAAGQGAPPIVTSDLVANALSGGASVTGLPHTPPLNGYGNQTHHTVGMYAAICGLAGLRAARISGRGMVTDLSAHEALISCTEQLLMQWWFPGSWKERVAPRQGGLHWSGAYALYPDRNGRGIQLTAALRFMEEILPWLERDGVAGDLTDPEKFPSFLAMVTNLPYVMDRLRAWAAKQDAWEFFFESQRRRLPYGVVATVDEVLKSPQVAARGWFEERQVPGAGPVQMGGRLFRTDADAPLPGPATPVAVASIAWAEPPAPAPARNVPAERPLTGVRILDFTHVLAGPFGTRVLGDLGADVIKVGTGARSAGANSQGHPYYIMWNRNKKSVNLNMGTERGRELARALAARSDAVMENFTAGVLARWGMDRAGLRGLNPRISVVSMGGMGQSGPWRDFLTFAPTIHALTGLTHMTNFPGEKEMVGYGFSLTDHLSGLAGAIAVLEGVEHARRTGEGIEVDLSQYELGLHLMAPTLIHALASGTTPEPPGNAHPWGAFAPHSIYRAAGEDRWVAIAVRGDAQWAALCGVMGREELATDSRFASHEARLANAAETDRLVEGWTRGLDRYEVMARCQAAGVAAGAVQDAADLMERDPATAARAFFGTAEGELGGYGIDRFPALFDGERPPHVRAVHAVGEDTFEVMQSVLGLDDGAVAELMAEGILS